MEEGGSKDRCMEGGAELDGEDEDEGEGEGEGERRWGWSIFCIIKCGVHTFRNN